mgnify:CR=1 FL=1
MLTEKDYCDYETSRELKELGFVAGLGEGDCGYCLYDDAWHDQVNRPLLYEVQKWLREEKRIGVFVSGFKNGYTFWVNNLLNGDTLYQGFFDNQTGEKYKSYEKALSEGIKEAVKILKEE